MGRVNYNKARFHLYRYQINPKDRYLQMDLFDGVNSLNELIEKKNEIFKDEFTSINTFKGQKSTISSSLLYSNNESLLFKFSAYRPVVIENKDFTKDTKDNWPSFLVFIWNSKDRQLIAIQERFEAFQDTNAVIHAIENMLNEKLKKKNLKAYFEPLTKSQNFWKIVDIFKEKIQEVTFELITPNMANISNTITDELKTFAKNTNTAKTRFQITSDSDSILNLDKDNQQLHGMLDYSSKGGGNISIKVRGARKIFNTKKVKKSIELDEMELEGAPTDIIKVIQGLIQHDSSI